MSPSNSKTLTVEFVDKKMLDKSSTMQAFSLCLSSSRRVVLSAWVRTTAGITCRVEPSSQWRDSSWNHVDSCFRMSLIGLSREASTKTTPYCARRNLTCNTQQHEGKTFGASGGN